MFFMGSLTGSPDSHIVPTRYWTTLDDGRVRCDVCPRFCSLHEGQRGFCFVRARQNDAVVLTTYGRSSGFCIDPIEKKPLNHFLPGSAVLSFGTAGLQSRLPVLSELGYQQISRNGYLASEATP
jgi:pyruvate formate lyase activating enzyme